MSASAYESSIACVSWSLVSVSNAFEVVRTHCHVACDVACQRLSILDALESGGLLFPSICQSLPQCFAVLVGLHPPSQNLPKAPQLLSNPKMLTLFETGSSATRVWRIHEAHRLVRATSEAATRAQEHDVATFMASRSRFLSRRVGEEHVPLCSSSCRPDFAQIEQASIGLARIWPNPERTCQTLGGLGLCDNLNRHQPTLARNRPALTELGPI